jgi:hypothetical protein
MKKVKDKETRTMVILYKDDLRAIERLRKKLVGLPASRYHSEVMRRAILLAMEKGIEPTEKMREACEATDEAPTKHAVVLRGLESALEKIQLKNKMDSVSSALRLVLRSVSI